MKKLFSVPAGIAAGIVSMAGFIPQAQAASSHDIFVSPSGKGTICSKAAPCSLNTGINHSNATIVFENGTYHVSSALQLTNQNSNSTWKADVHAHPVIDGGMSLTSWSSWKNGIMRTKVPVGTQSRQLYVNGNAASMASVKASDLLGTITKTTTGYTTTKDASQLKGAELRWEGSAGANIDWEGWVDRSCPISDATSNTITVAEPCWDRQYPTGTQGVNLPTHVQNTLLALTKPGQFYLDSANGYVYYMPKAGDNLKTAVLPVAQGLVRGNNVSNLTIRGIRFSHDTWVHPSTAGGFPDGQATIYQDDSGSSIPPGAIQFNHSDHVSIIHSNVNRTGAAGIQFTNGSSNNTVDHTVVYDTAGSGVELGTLNPDEVAANSNNKVTNNYIHNVGTQYEGGVGIFAGYVRGTNIAHNFISNSNYTGISLGWGWGTPSAMGDNHIDYNRITRTMQSVLFDGGSIYVNGTTDPNAKSTMIGNYVNNVGNHGTSAQGLYLDGSSSNWVVKSNVALNMQNWVALQTVPGQVAKNNDVENNWTSSKQVLNGADKFYTVDPSNTVKNNTTGMQKPTPTAQSIINHSGVMR